MRKCDIMITIRFNDRRVMCMIKFLNTRKLKKILLIEDDNDFGLAI